MAGDDGVTDRREARIAFGVLVATLAVLAAASLWLPVSGPIPASATDELPLPRPLMAVVVALAFGIAYGGAGLVGLRAAAASGWPSLFDSGVSRWQRFLVPAVCGSALGILFIAGDALLAPANGFGRLPHPPFPLSIVASITAAIGEEILFRLLLVAGGFWLLSRIVRGALGREIVFWLVATAAGLAFAASHLPGLLLLLGDGRVAPLNAVPIVLAGQLLILNVALSLVSAQLLRRFGPLAAIGVHFWADLVWHVIWGAM
jgi:membrane protease YdiL (CAAX protease family)